MKPNVRKTGKSMLAAKNQNVRNGKLAWRRKVDEDKVSESFDRFFGKKDPLSFHTGKRYTIKY